jgi:hypothetical protein
LMNVDFDWVGHFNTPKQTEQRQSSVLGILNIM